jgi:hypothetical protein
VRAGLKHVLALLPLFRTSVYRKWCNIVHASDASPFGLGVCSRSCSINEVRHLGRFSERWRFKIEDTLQAQTHAWGLVSAHLPDSEAISIVAESGLCSFAEVSPDLLHCADWAAVHGSLFGFIKTCHSFGGGRCRPRSSPLAKIQPNSQMPSCSSCR